LKIANILTNFLIDDAKNQIRNSVRVSYDKIFVDNSFSGGLRLSIHQLNGRIAHSFSQPSPSTGPVQIFSLRSLALGKGTYLLRLRNKNNELMQKLLLR
jgi:hypothetical protein